MSREEQVERGHFCVPSDQEHVDDDGDDICDLAPYYYYYPVDSFCNVPDVSPCNVG